MPSGDNRPEIARDASVSTVGMRQHALEIIEWLVSDECHDLDGAGLIDGLGTTLCKTGMPLHRMVLHSRALHPTVFGRSIAWAPEEAVAYLDTEHGEERSARLQKSPVLHVMRTRTWLVLRTDDRRWSLGDLFLGRGLTELIIAPIIHGTAVSAVTFATGRATGFSPAEQALLHRILPALRCVIELKIWRRTTATLLGTYIGTDAEKRILSGLIRRGDVETLEAALMFCDMRGFTELSNRLPSERVLEVLNSYFDQVVPAVIDGGGEILKFMGDGLLAFFRDGAGPAASCAAAFKAARLVHERLGATPLPDAVLRAGIALHFGKVSYGNIGSGERLDFTVIGRDVNLTSRIQGLCGSTSHPLLMSERFAGLLALPGTASIGWHAIKGFVEPVEVFACTDFASFNVTKRPDAVPKNAWSLGGDGGKPK
jgi:adenylate cyclase